MFLLSVPLKMARLKAWCEDINQQQERCFDLVYVTQAEFESLLARIIQRLDLFVTDNAAAA